MKKFIVIVLAFAALAFAPAAQADVPATPTSLCQQGGALAACPNGVPSNVSASVADAYSHYSGTGQSVGGDIGNGTSVSAASAAAGNQSVAAPRNSATTSVAWTQAPNGSSVAFGGSSSNSVAGGSISGGSSASVVH